MQQQQVIMCQPLSHNSQGMMLKACSQFKAEFSGLNCDILRPPNPK
jgi:hypothetical protein